MFRKFLARLRGSSRAPEDLALGTKRPGDFVEGPADPANEQATDDRQGAEASRALYVAERRTIYVNLDFPQLAAAKGGRSVSRALTSLMSFLPRKITRQRYRLKNGNPAPVTSSGL